jgi:hypothetical protein
MPTLKSQDFGTKLFTAFSQPITHSFSTAHTAHNSFSEATAQPNTPYVRSQSDNYERSPFKDANSKKPGLWIPKKS